MGKQKSEMKEYAPGEPPPLKDETAPDTECKDIEEERWKTRGSSPAFNEFWKKFLITDEAFPWTIAPDAYTTVRTSSLNAMNGIMFPLFSYDLWDISSEKKQEIAKVLEFLYLENSNMSQKEVEIIEKYCTPNSRVIEFGTGFSTLHLAKKCKSLISVEHNAEWFLRILMLSQILDVKYLASCGPPTNNIEEVASQNVFEADEKKYRLYINAIDGFAETAPEIEFDVVSIDGVARPNCAKAVLPYLHDDSVVIISDFWRPDRQLEREYSKVFEWYDEVESFKEGNTYIVLKRKSKKGGA